MTELRQHELGEHEARELGVRREVVAAIVEGIEGGGWCDDSIDWTETEAAQAWQIVARRYQSQRDTLAGGIRSFLTSLPFAAPESLGWQANVKLAGALDRAGLPPAGARNRSPASEAERP